MPYEDIDVLANLVLMLTIAHPRATAMHFHKYWYLHVVTREYAQPSYGELQLLVKEARGSN